MPPFAFVYFFANFYFSVDISHEILTTVVATKSHTLNIKKSVTTILPSRLAS